MFGDEARVSDGRARVADRRPLPKLSDFPLAGSGTFGSCAPFHPSGTGQTRLVRKAMIASRTTRSSDARDLAQALRLIASPE
jgi:hypothetical protein